MKGFWKDLWETLCDLFRTTPVKLVEAEPDYDEIVNWNERKD